MPDGWQSAELQQFLAVSRRRDRGRRGERLGGRRTERGDPQVFLLGPPPDYDCILSISRLGRLYVIEDGNGRVLFEHDNPMLLAEQAARCAAPPQGAIVARVAVAWCALREAFEEKTKR